MATGSVKLGVSGIGEFKSAMTQAKNSTRTLESEMKLAQAQFRATGDAETYMQQRASILTQQMSQQQAALDAARAAMERMDSQGIDPSSAAYQQMQRAAYDAERELVRLRQEADRTGDELSETSNATNQASSALSTLKSMAGFGSLAAGFATVKTIVGQVTEKVKELQQRLYESAQWADDLNTKSARYGLSAEELQRWEFASNFAETDVDTLLKARDRLMQQMGSTDQLREWERQLETATGDQKKTLQGKIGESYFMQLSDGVKAYAVALRDASGEARDSMDVFWDFIDVLKQIDNQTERDRIAQEYFGKSFRELQTLIDGGREGWEEYAQSASAVSQESVDALNKVQDERDRLEHERSVYEKNQDAKRAAEAEAYNKSLADAYHAMNESGMSKGEYIGTGAAVAAAYGVEKASNWLRALFGAEPKYENPEADLAQMGRDAGLTTGEAAADAFATGAESGEAAAYAAGAALGAATVAGFAANAGGGGSVTNNSTQNFGDTYNIYGGGTEDAAAAARRQAAGYGG
jgi:hypothetical protein